MKWTWLLIDEVVHFVDYPPLTTDSIFASQIYTNALEDYIHQLWEVVKHTSVYSPAMQPLLYPHCESSANRGHAA